MATYEESGLRLTLPDDQHFRFADLAPYRSLSGQHLKEMDFAWIDGQGRLILLEVRSYAQVTETLTGPDFMPTKGRAAPFRFQALLDKVTDTLLMLAAVWSGTAWGRTLSPLLPLEARQPLPLKVVIAVDLPPALTVHLQGLRDSLNARLQGRLALVDVPRVVLIDHARLLSNPMFSSFVQIAQP